MKSVSRSVLAALALAFSLSFWTPAAEAQRTFVTLPSVLAWSGSTSYHVGDLTSSGGATYISLLANNLNNAPATSPTQWAAVGAVGAGGSTVYPQNARNIYLTPDVSGNNYIAFNAAITSLTAAGGGTVWLSCGVFPVTGALQDTSGANALLPMPRQANYAPNTPLIAFHGCAKPTPAGPGSSISMITYTSSTGNLFGGYDSDTGGSYPPFTNAWLHLEDLEINGPPNPGSVAVNAKYILYFTYADILVSAGTVGVPTNAAGVAVIFPSLANGVRLQGTGTLAIGGFYTGFIPGEHTHLDAVYVANYAQCMVGDVGTNAGAPSGYIGNTIQIDYLWCGPGTDQIVAGANKTAIHFGVADFETGTRYGINDPSNLLYISGKWNVPYPSAGYNYCTLPKNGGSHAVEFTPVWCPTGGTPPPAPLFSYRICGDVSSGSGCVPTTSTTVYDASGNGHNGTWNGTQSGTTAWYTAATWDPYAGTFDGSTNFVQSTFTPTSVTSFTVVAQLKTSANPSAGFILSSRTSSANSGFALFTTPGPSSTINLDGYIFSSGGASSAQVTSGLGAVGTTHCIAMTHVGGAAAVTLYIDGTAAGSSTGATATDPDNGGPLYIGKDGTNTAANPFPGLVGDVRYYNSVLSPGTIPGCI